MNVNVHDLDCSYSICGYLRCRMNRSRSAYHWQRWIREDWGW